MDTIKVAFLASSFTVGGAEMVMRDVILGLPPGRFSSRLLFLKSPGIIGEELFARGVPGEAGLLSGRYDPAVLFRLIRRLRAFSPHILFTLDHRNALLWGRLAALSAGVPARAFASHSTGRPGGGRNFNIIDHGLMWATDTVVALSESHATYLAGREKIPASKITIIENGIDTGRFAHVDRDAIDACRSELAIPDGCNVVMMVAALRPEKAHEAFLDAARSLSESMDNIRFLVVGGGPREQELRELSSRLSLEDRVLFLGRRSDIPVLLGLADVLVLPSHPVVETLPLVVLEAMAAGVPVVASAVGSVPEVVRDGETGLLIPPADSHALAEAVTRLFNHRSLGHGMAERAKKLVLTRYTSVRMVDGYVALFERLARKGLK